MRECERCAIVGPLDTDILYKKACDAKIRLENKKKERYYNEYEKHRWNEPTLFGKLLGRKPRQLSDDEIDEVIEHKRKNIIMFMSPEMICKHLYDEPINLVDEVLDMLKNYQVNRSAYIPMENFRVIRNNQN